MKTPTNLFKSGFITLGWIVFILLCYYAFKEEKANMQVTMGNYLHKAIDLDYQERLSKILVSYRPLGRKIKNIQIKCEDRIETISFEDSTHEYSALQLANQYIMAQVIPVNPDSLNKTFHKEWEKHGITVLKTGIVYSHNQKKRFSENDSVSFRSALVTPVQMIDSKKTAGVQAWVVIHPAEIIKHIPFKALWSIIAYFLALSWYSLSLLRKPRDKDIPANPDCIQWGKMTLKLESQKLYINGQPCPITPADFNLLLLFVNAPEHFLTKEDIKNKFWPKDDNPDNKIYSHISTLKSSLKIFPEYQILTLQKGYHLVLPLPTTEKTTSAK